MSSIKFPAIIAIVVFVCVAALIALQVLEFQFYG